MPCTVVSTSSCRPAPRITPENLPHSPCHRPAIEWCMPQQLNLPNFFAGPYIDRRSEVREDEAALRAIRADPQTRYVLSVGGLQLLHAEGPASAARVAFLSSDDPIVRGTAETDLVLLGQFQDSWCMLI